MEKRIAHGFLREFRVYGMDIKPGNAVQPYPEGSTTFNAKILVVVFVQVRGKVLKIFVYGPLGKLQALGEFLAGKITV